MCDKHALVSRTLFLKRVHFYLKRLFLLLMFFSILYFFNISSYAYDVPDGYVFLAENDKYIQYFNLNSISDTSRQYAFLGSVGGEAWLYYSSIDGGNAYEVYNAFPWFRKSDSRYFANSAILGEFLGTFDYDLLPVKRYYSDFYDLASALSLPYSPSNYDDSVFMGLLWHTTLRINDDYYYFVNVGLGNADNVQLNIFKNGILMFGYGYNVNIHQTPLNQIWSFTSNELGFVDGDIIKIVATPYDINGNWGNSKSIEFIAKSFTNPISIIDIPNLTPTLNGSPVLVTSEPIIEYRGTSSTIVNTTTVYTQNTTIVNNGITDEQLQLIIDSILENISRYQGDSVTTIVNNNNYGYVVDYDSTDLDNNINTFKSKLNTIIDYLMSVRGTPIEPIIVTIVANTVLLTILAFSLLALRIIRG